MWIFTDASRKEGEVGVGIAKFAEGIEVERAGRRLQTGYPVHMAELWALGIAANEFTGNQKGTINLITDSRTALDMVTRRKGGTAACIDEQLRRIESRGAEVKLWWATDQISGVAIADQIARRAREDPGGHPQQQAFVTGRMLKDEAARRLKERWQEAWTTESKGRLTYRFIPDVSFKLRKWSHRAVCLLTGHGPFKGYFRRFNLKAGTGECSCGEGLQDTAEHAMEECQSAERTRARENFRKRQRETGGLFPFQVQVETKEKEVGNFNQWANEIGMEEEHDTVGEEAGPTLEGDRNSEEEE